MINKENIKRKKLSKEILKKIHGGEDLTPACEIIEELIVGQGREDGLPIPESVLDHVCGNIRC